jgi:MFS family permease
MTNSVLVITAAALGYFVDIYDLLLFSIVRVQSLKSLGLGPSEITSVGVFLINAQMAGLLVGGLFWGIMADKKGRVQVLFGSILLYSLANLANGFVQNVETYALFRFLAGIGLAGELGAGITLICEILPSHRRGYATALIASIGISGAVFAGVLADHLDWRLCYEIGGAMGLGLLLLRFKIKESSIYLKHNVEKRGQFHRILFEPRLLLRYLKILGTGLPFWFVVGILITFAPEFTQDLKLEATPIAGLAVTSCYAGAMLGDLLAGLLSQRLKSRKKVILGFILATAIAISLHLLWPSHDLQGFYGHCFLLGLTAGYWALFVTISAESFGTNLRGTVATTIPNFVRGSVIPLSLSFKSLSAWQGPKVAALELAGFTVLIAIICLFWIEETYSKDLNYLD